MVETIIILCLIVILMCHSSTRKKNFPPGPIGLPFVGYYPFIDHADLEKSWKRLSATYGSVVGMKWANWDVVLISGWEAIKEAFLNEDLAGRPDACLMRDRFDGKNYGIVFTDGDTWKSQRRFTLHHFRNLGFGRRAHESVIHEEVRAIIDDLKKAKEPIYPESIVGTSLLNILWSLIGGTRYDRNDPQLMEFVKHVTNSLHSIPVTGGVAVACPPLRHVLQEFTGYKQIKAGSEWQRKFMMKFIDDHKASLNPENPRDFIDIYLTEMMKNDSNESFTDDQLIAICIDLLTAGTDTTSTVITFALLFMCLHQDIQSRIHQELDSLIGADSLPSVDDRARLVLTDATIQEVLRYRCITPVVIPHRALRNTVVKGYDIPEGTAVLIYLNSILMDREYWKDPDVFRPERFISEDGKLRKDERLIPFGKGKRSCLGKPLARMGTFLIFSGLMKNFHFQIPPGDPIPNTEGRPGFTLLSPHFKILVTPRF